MLNGILIHLLMNWRASVIA